MHKHFPNHPMYGPGAAALIHCPSLFSSLYTEINDNPFSAFRNPAGDH